MLSKLKIDLAPMQGVTNDLYRKLYQQSFGGVDRFYTPFVKIQKQDHRSKKKKKVIFRPYNSDLPVVPQILSHDSDEIILMDHELQGLGYPVFNWNLGCPAPTVINKKRGSGLLPYPDKIQEILDYTLPKLNCQISIKTRLGLTNPNELLHLIPILNEFPIAELIIHPRLGKQLYQGHVDLISFGKCLSMSRHPVVYNGDIFNVKTFQQLQDQFSQVNRWMLGRGLLANPFLAEQIKELPALSTGKLERLIQFHDNYIKQYSNILSGPGHLLDKIKELWSYLHFIVEDNHLFYRRLTRIKKFKDYQNLINDFFSNSPKLVEHLNLESELFR